MSPQDKPNMRLDTARFDDAIRAFDRQLRQLQQLTEQAQGMTGEIVDPARWTGKGRDAFAVDCALVMRNFHEINDLMTGLRAALAEAQSQYLRADRALADRFEG